MEPDRYQQNHACYIVGMISLVLSLIFLAISAYLMPFLVFQWRYSVPDFVISWVDRIQENFSVSHNLASWYLFVFLFFWAIVFTALTYVLSNRLDDEVLGIRSTHSPQPTKLTRRQEATNSHEARNTFFRILLMVIFIVIAVELFNLIISATA